MTAGDTRETHWEASRGLRRAGIALLAAGALLRILISVLSSRVTPVSDMAWYLGASRVLGADTNLLVGTDRALLYPVFLGGLAAVGLGSLLAYYMVQSVLTLAAVAATAWFAARVGGARLGWLTAALLAPQLTVAQYSGLLLSESLFLPLFALWLALAWPAGDAHAVSRQATLRIAVAGAAAGIAGAVRPAALPLALGTALALLLVGDRRLRAAGTFVAAAAIVFVVAVLATAHVARVAPSFLPTAGVNLYLGNGPGSRLDGGGMERLPPSLQAVHDPAARNAQARREALREMARRPLRTSLVFGIRLVRLASVNPGRIEHDALVAEGWPSALAIAWLGCEWLGCAVLAVMAWRGKAMTRSALVFTTLVAAPYVLVLASTFVQTRFRLPLVLLLAPVAAAGLGRLLEAPRTPSGRRRSIVAGLAAAALVVAATAVELALKRP